ncbi:alpha/beta hydrolase [Streptosporangium sp. NPDC048047]|uniref:alpha/beta hydrolase family protein n=1 Tax=Streptosporangium sp. NPDC048047 TaxID=3155748 RepID=UPI00343D78E2
MPTGPRPYDVAFPSGEVTLAGSLTVPERGGEAAGVVMVGGSGPSDRDNDVYFPPIRRHLADTGIAVLSYDKRGVGGSSGEWRDATIGDLAADAAAALDFLRATPGVRAGAVGLFGHSEGGWVVLRAAAVRDDLPWVITNSCPATTPAVQERHALTGALRRAGADARDTGRTLALYDHLVEAGRAGADFATAAGLVGSAGPSPAFASYWAEVDERLWRFLRRKQDHDPVPDAERLRCPHLAIFGGADELVPVAESVRLFGDAACRLDRHPRARLTVEVFPGADHRVQTDGEGLLASCYLTILARWIGQHTPMTPTP